MRYISRIVGLLSATSLLIVGLTPGLAAAAADIQAVTHTVTFDATGIANGSTYDLTIAGTTYSVTAITGPDKTIEAADGATFPYSYDPYAYESGTKRVQLSGTPSPSSPLHITGNTDVSATYVGGIDYLLTFDQIGLPVGTTYSLTWAPGGEYNVPMTAGTPHTAWGRVDTWPEITYYPAFNIPLGAYVLGSLNVNGSGYHITGPANIVGTFISGNITGTVFYDYNNNGVQDPGEPGVPNANVELVGSHRTLSVDGAFTDLHIPGGLSTLLTSMSDGIGDYAFNNLPAGTFYVRAQLPDGSWQESPAITLAVTGGAMNSGQADFPEALPYTGK